MQQSPRLDSGKRSIKDIVSAFILCAVLVLLVLSSVPNMDAAGECGEAQVLAEAASDGTPGFFEPTMTKPDWVDQNNNCIADALDEEIAQRLVNNVYSEYADVIVALRSEPTARDTATFAHFGGQVVTQLLTYAIYGFGGRIPYGQISSFARSDPNVLLIEKDQICYAQIAYASQQVGARPYVWHDLGLLGDPQSSIAILDTGIDDSHADFALGYGAQNFTRKIVGWNDLIMGSTEPADDNGHGSHVAGLAAGNGFFSTNASGNALASWGANLGAVTESGGYLISGIMVNKTGNITVTVKWTNTGTGKLSELRLYSGNKSLETSSWIRVASVSTPLKDTWYTLNYPVNAMPSEGYNMYHVVMFLTAGTGELYTMFQTSYPYTPPADEFSAWTGIAPQAKLVGVKVLDSSGSGSSLELLSAINWVIANRQTYHIVVVSMSLGFGSEVANINNAVVNLVKNGITTVVSAGNSGVGGNYIFTPGSVDEAITVAATNQFDNIADYSSQGGTSRYKGKTIKPDIAAPGGSFFAVPLLSADSNDNEAEGMWTEVYVNDSAPMQGTSMSAPVVAGAANIIVQALGGFSSWQWTRSQALQPKMILLMTATETYPNVREYDTSFSPTLERGGKDVHEGYGRLNLDAAVDALQKSLEIGTTVTDVLGKPPVITDISGLGQKLAWARRIQLNTEGEYNFTLAVPSGADFDLYLYNCTGTSYGEPAIVAKSTNATTGGYEQIISVAPYNGTYYLVVKRATSTTEGGTFTLQSTVTASHEISMLTVEPMPIVVYPIDPVNITVTVKNKGLSAESFNVTVYYNVTAISTQTVLDLPPNNVKALNFTWSTIGVTPSHYVITAQADPVPNEYNTTDNIATYAGTVTVKILGDANTDNVVDDVDLVQLMMAYGSAPSSGNWNPECDFNRDLIVDARDLRLLGRSYGESL